MSPRGWYRRLSVQFELQLCTDIRAGKVARREAMRAHRLSANLLLLSLTQYDQGSLNEEVAAASVAEYEAKFNDVASRLPTFIDQVYNARRTHSSIGYLPSNGFEDLVTQQAA